MDEKPTEGVLVIEDLYSTITHRELTDMLGIRHEGVERKTPSDLPMSRIYWTASNAKTVYGYVVDTFSGILDSDVWAREYASTEVEGWINFITSTGVEA